MKKLLLALLLFPFFAFGADLRYTGTFSGPQPQPAAGSILRSNATSWLGTTATFADTYTSGGLLFSNGANTVQGSPFITFTGTVFSFAGDNPAADLTYNVTHTGSNAASRGVISVAQGGAGGGDAVVQWILSGVQSWTAGADISASNAWKLSAGTALGTNDAITVSTAGAVAIPGTLGLSGVLTSTVAQTVDGALAFGPIVRSTEAYSTSPASGIALAAKYDSGGAYGTLGGIQVRKFDAVDGNYGGFTDLVSRVNAGALVVGLTLNGTKVYMPALTEASGTPSSVCMNAATQEITVNAALTCTVSSERFKDAIHHFDGSGLRMVASMQPETFFYKDRPDRQRIGFIAEQLAAIDPRLSEWDSEGRPHSIDFSAVMGVLVKAINEQQAQIQALREKVDSLTGMRHTAASQK